MLQSNLSNIKYATRSADASAYQNDNMIKYEANYEYQYTAAADGEDTVIIPDLVGALRVLHIVNEIKGMAVTDFSFNSNTGQINLLNGITLTGGQTLFIIYVNMVTS